MPVLKDGRKNMQEHEMNSRNRKKDLTFLIWKETERERERERGRKTNRKNIL